MSYKMKEGELGYNAYLTRERPATFFKYHKIDKNLDSVITNHAVWFQSQKSLNDIREGKYALSKELMNTLIEMVVDASLPEVKDLMPPTSTKEEVEDYIRNLFGEEEMMNSCYNLLFADEGLGHHVCCFTEDNGNEVLWGNYADNHYGVCLEFDFTHTPNLLTLILPVDYEDELPVLNSLDDLGPALKRKQKVWSYEKEWRIIAKHGGLHSFEKQSLRTIHFGARAKEEDIDNLKKLLADGGGYEHVTFEKRQPQAGPDNFKDLGKDFYKSVMGE